MNRRNVLEARLAALETELAAVTRERDAYRRAKQENDERFMVERDEARAERDAALAKLARYREMTLRIGADAVGARFAAMETKEEWALAMAAVTAERDLARDKIARALGAQWPCAGKFYPLTQEWTPCPRRARYRVDDAWCACEEHRQSGARVIELPWVEILEEP